MLFNSYEFIFLFLPIVLAGYFFIGKKHDRAANVWLALASLFFYGYWNKNYLPLLIMSIAVNYTFAGLILNARSNKNASHSKMYFILGLIFNLGLLGYYKYFNFMIENLNRLGTNFELINVILPLGISFFTITQLLYLFDCYEGVAKDHNLVNYALFVSFFPHLMAGPILYHRQMMKQFDNPSLRQLDWSNMSRGLTLFIIGLMKKVLIADELSPYVGLGYSHTAELDCLTAWLVAISYMLQLYFDFSGYSDMAVGLSRIMNLEIPINFNSPYRASSMINFWQRWHISLTNAITACVYMPIVKFLKTRTLMHTITASFISLFIVGIWHGAGWTFVIFAFLNAIGITINYIWKHYKLSMPKILAHIITLTYVLLTMVFFRASSVQDAINVFKSMAGLNGIVFPQKIVTLAEHLGILIPVGDVPGTLSKTIFIIAVLLVALCPNSNQLIKNFKPSYTWLVVIVVGFILTILSMTQPTEFLYFQF
ncbi:MAG: MBOAT family protein [Selenomonadaceae bacterium]|nr:MBOAT family protein [Selenomonadaceae bacterium]